MTNCKECLKSDVCKYNDGVNLWCKGDYDCPKFVDLNRNLELPCNVGDTVYYFCETFGVILPYFVESLNITYLDKNKAVYQYEANATNTEENELLDSIDFEPDDIGKTVFLTYEEAEKALERSNNNGKIY